MTWQKVELTKESLIPSLACDAPKLLAQIVRILQDDLGPVVNEKMRALNWTAEQYDNFFNHLHSEMSRDALVDALVEFAPPEWFESEADAAGLFENDEKMGTE
jgi:hypothetical protein